MVRLPQLFARFQRDQRGAALVEFAISLPLILLLFASVIEGGRMVWAYQAASSGVRDAVRYLARVAPRDICTSGGSVDGYAVALKSIVERDHADASFFPTGMSVNTVTPSLTCVTGTYRNGAAIAQVSANITINMPFSSVFTFAGQNLAVVTATITDQSRIYGS